MILNLSGLNPGVKGVFTKCFAFFWSNTTITGDSCGQVSMTAKYRTENPSPFNIICMSVCVFVCMQIQYAWTGLETLYLAEYTTQLVRAQVFQWTGKWPTGQPSLTVLLASTGIFTERTKSRSSPGVLVRGQLKELLLCSFVFHTGWKT